MYSNEQITAPESAREARKELLAKKACGGGFGHDLREPLRGHMAAWSRAGWKYSHVALRWLSYAIGRQRGVKFSISYGKPWGFEGPLLKLP
jgi:hypothetical protein